MLLQREYRTRCGVIHYWISKKMDSEVTLVFLPGLTADHHLFDQQTAYFAGKYSVFVWDAPGHASSAPFDFQFDLFDKAKWLDEILTVEALKNPVIIGQSMGGYVGQAYAQLFPGKLKGFISIDSAPLQRRYVTAAEIWLLKRMESVYRYYPWKWLLWSGTKGIAVSAYGRKLMYDTMKGYEGQKERYAKLAGHGFRILAEAMERDLPYRISCPALLLCGEKDHAGSCIRYNRAWHKHTGIRLEWIKNAGHNSNTDAPERVNCLIEEHVIQCASGARTMEKEEYRKTMNYRFYNAKILTMETTDIIEGELWVQDDKILYVGEGGDAAAVCQSLSMESILWDREIDCGGNLLMPGFKDAHTHSAMTFLRSYADDLPLQDWLFQQVFPMEAKLDGEMIYHLTKLAVLEYLTSGITSIFDMYLSPEDTARACVEMGMRCVQVSGASGQEGFEDSLAKMEERYHSLNNFDPLHSYFIGFHAEYTCSRALLEQVAAMAHKYKAPVFTHLSETKAEVEGCRERYGMSPVKLLNSLGMFDYGGGGYHCVWMDEEDMDIFAKRGLSVVTNPGSNTKLASGIAPISAYLKRGINVAVGTDGPASNNCLDMFREMFLVTGLAKLREQDAAAVDALEVLKMATVNGAKAMNLPDTDVLAAGKQADVIMIDLHQPNMQPLNNIAKNLVYSGSKQNVKMTMIRGRILYENGQFAKDIDVEEIYGKANEIIDSLR